jgi:pyruvate/2-oxoglutarate dehydrogenase complex dihydrolipoamide dehydrogenase (E3) component
VDSVGGEWLYAVGDVCGRALLTHMGKYQARIAGDVSATWRITTWCLRSSSATPRWHQSA